MKTALLFVVGFLTVFLTSCGNEKEAAPNPSLPSTPAPPALKTVSTEPVAVENVKAVTIIGKVSLDGSPTPEKIIEGLKNDAVCGKLNNDTPKTRLYVVSGDGHLADTLVYVKQGLEGKTFPPSAQPVILDQKGCEYLPYVVAVQTGQPLVIKNSDPALHNINAAGLKNNKPFNEAQAGNGPDKQKIFDKPELFASFACNVHPWMFAYVSVLENPFFAVSDKDGNFKITGLPPGKYVIEAYHRKAGKVMKEITVGKDAEQTLDFTLQVPKPL